MKDRFPPGINNAFYFALCNALSFQIVLSSPMVLFAKSLGASATVLGIITGMMPLLVILQIPAANYIPRVGYKRFVFSGWGIRVLFIFGMAVVPWTGTFLNQTTQLVLILSLLFGFNLSRGISSCAWLPWITSIIPQSIRGRYLVIDTACQNASSFVAFIIAAWVLGRNPESWQFAGIFTFSALTGLWSLGFLKKIPEGSSPGEVTQSSTPVPWREIAHYPPFRKLLRMNIAWSIGYGGMIAFTVAYLKSHGGFHDGQILLLSSVYFLGGLASLSFGNRMDRMGSKPILAFAGGLWLLIAIGWTLLAMGILPTSGLLVILLELFMGLGYALFNTSNLRLGMVISPVMGRSHFFAVFQVVSNLTLGLSPIVWGLLIDGLGTREWCLFSLTIDRYGIFFVGAGLSFAVMASLVRSLEEPSAARVQELLMEVLVSAPQRVWARLMAR